MEFNYDPEQIAPYLESESIPLPRELVQPEEILEWMQGKSDELQCGYDLSRMREHVESETVYLPKPEGDRRSGDIKAWLLSQGAGGQQGGKEAGNATT